MVAALAKNQIAMMNLQDDEPVVQLKVAKHMEKLEQDMKSNEPARWRELNDLVLQPHHVQGLLGVVNSMRDPRVQETGRKLVQAFADGRSEGREGVKRQLKQVFNEEELQNLRQLKGEIFQGMMRPAPEGSKVTFDADALRMMKAIPDTTASAQARRMSDSSSSSLFGFDFGDFDDSMTGATDESDTVSFLGSFEEQCRTLLDQIDQVGQSFGWDSQIPAEAQAGVGGIDFLTNVFGCLQRAEGNDVKEAMCPGKFSSALFDSMSAVDNELGVNNDNLGLTNTGSDSVFNNLFGSSSSGSSSNSFNPFDSSSSSSNSFGNMFNSFFGDGSSSTSTSQSSQSPLNSWS